VLTSVLTIEGQVGGCGIALSALGYAVAAATGDTSMLVAALGQPAISEVPVPTRMGCGGYECRTCCR